VRAIRHVRTLEAIRWKGLLVLERHRNQRCKHRYPDSDEEGRQLKITARYFSYACEQEMVNGAVSCSLGHVARRYAPPSNPVDGKLNSPGPLLPRR